MDYAKFFNDFIFRNFIANNLYAQYGTGIEFFGERRKKITCFFLPCPRIVRQTTHNVRRLGAGGASTKLPAGDKRSISHKIVYGLTAAILQNRSLSAGIFVVIISKKIHIL
jgi:hypothetical protein